VALARAAYSGASVHLLDDPLSAVDPRVGQVLFDKCIGPTGLLKGEWFEKGLEPSRRRFWLAGLPQQAGRQA
jgi:hypothetical protein